MSLRARQIAFRDEIVGDDDSGATSPGMAIYRDAYRARLLAALETSFERTRRWVGDAAFTAAAAHFVLSEPPRSWTLDDYGAGFPRLLRTLFAGDPEVEELAWLEWHLQRAFASPDAPRLDPAILAAQDIGDDDWDRMTFTMAPGFAVRAIATDCTALWTALRDGDAAGFAVGREDGGLIVWRDGLAPRYRVVGDDERLALVGLMAGGTLGAVARTVDAVTLGEWLARWLGEGLFSGAADCGTASQAARAAPCGAE